MTRRLLALVLVVGCASHQRAATTPADSTAQVDAAAAASGVCLRQAAVTVHVLNRGSSDVQISFGAYTPARAAQGFSSTTYKISRSYLTGAIQLRILRGGLQIGGPARITTEPVVCNDATLVIGPEPRISFFYGDLIREPAGKKTKPDSTSDSTSLAGGFPGTRR